MTRYAIDAPTLLHVVRSGLRLGPDDSLVAPNRILGEALTSLLSEVRRGATSDREALALHTAMTETKIRLLGDRVSRGTAWRIARERDWSDLRDAEYLAIASLQSDALATLDAALAEKAPGIVPVVPPDLIFR